MSYRLKPGVVMAGANGSFGPGQVLPDDFNPAALEQLQKAAQVEEVTEPPADSPRPETSTPPAGETAVAPSAPKPPASNKVVTVKKPS